MIYNLFGIYNFAERKLYLMKLGKNNLSGRSWSDSRILTNFIETQKSQGHLKVTADLDNMDYSEDMKKLDKTAETKPNVGSSEEKDDDSVFTQIKSGNCSEYQLVSENIWWCLYYLKV